MAGPVAILQRLVYSPHLRKTKSCWQVRRQGAVLGIRCSTCLSRVELIQSDCNREFRTPDPRLARFQPTICNAFISAFYATPGVHINESI
jgi:hypothetical protein